VCRCLLFVILRPPCSSLFPYTTLFRSLFLGSVVSWGAPFLCVRQTVFATRPDRCVPSLVCPSLSAPGHASAAAGPALLLLTSGTAGHPDLRERCRHGHADDAHAGDLRS